MNKIFYSIIGIFLLINSCNKNEKVESSSLNQNKNSTSLGNASGEPQIASMGNNNRLKPLAEEAGVGKVVFKANNSTVLFYSHLEQSGKITIDGKEYGLNQMVFTENNYEISGNNIKITAENGNFKDMASDCLFGNFPKIHIKLGSESIILTNIEVQDCPSY